MDRAGRPQSANEGTGLKRMLILSCAALLVRLSIGWLSIPALMQKTIPDDAFYYFSIARHMALDGTVSIDGISATNGFHPLWLLLIAPFYLVLPQDLEIPIHLALTLGAILDTAAGFLAYKLVHLLTDHTSVAIISALVYLVNPRTVFYAISGMETPLNVCVFALFVYGYALITLRRATLRRYVFFGIAGGLLLLARTDNICCSA